jgi:hypothetical protein
MEAPVLPTSPMRTGNLVLKTRITLVIRNLEQVQHALATVKQRRMYLRQVLEFPEFTKAATDKIGVAFNRVLDAYETGSSWEEVSATLKTIGKELEALSDATALLAEPVAELRRAVKLEEADLAKTDIVTNAIHESLRNAMSAEFGVELEHLQALRAKIDAGGNPEVMNDAWDEYLDRLYKSSERLFQEYVDLVSGVAIRDAGFDRGIARLAEDLLKPGETIGSFTWKTLTIPAREEALAVTAARIVRLGFPEWTIWTLPLTAYELGSNYADSDKKVGEAIKAHGGEPDELFILVADAFATYFLGPAYACAAMLMRLNPAEAFNGSRLVAKRAAVILSVLLRMSENAPGVEDHYSEITSRLAVEWEAALRQTGWDGLVDGNAPGADAGLQRLTGLTREELAAIDRLLAAFEPLVDVWIVSDAEVWPKVEEWAGKLRNEQELLASDLSGPAELRYVLNSAWRARIAVQPPETDVYDARKLAKIAESVECLLWSLVTGPKGPATVSDASLPRPPLQIPRYKADRRVQPVGMESA